MSKDANLRNIEKPIFIFGCCNSGTTILWNTLKKHKGLSGPEVEGQDLEELPDSMKHYLGKATFRLWAHPRFKLCYYSTEYEYDLRDKKIIEKVYQKYLSSQTRLIVKSPADSLRARLIQSYFPDAYFIAIVRNGYAVSEGIVRKRKEDPDRSEFHGLHTTIEEAAEQWFRANNIILSHQKFLLKYKIVRYEDLVENPKKVLHSVLDFCELNQQDFPIPFFDKNLNEKQILRLQDYEIETITRIAQPMLIHFDYKILNKKLNW